MTDKDALTALAASAWERLQPKQPMPARSGWPFTADEQPKAAQPQAWPYTAARAAKKVV